MDKFPEIDEADRRITKPLPHEGGWIVREKLPGYGWKRHPEATHARARVLVRKLKAALAVSLAIDARGVPWKVSKVDDARIAAGRDRADWKREAARIIKEL